MASSLNSNRLLREKSPYLLQHAHNPVDWYAWGTEAFAKARQEDKPILLSIGYSTCHWCHVMERESYEDAAVAAIMNQYLVNIKVDREERPEVDKIYMMAVSAMTGQGGWPLNVFLTPDLKPIFGGTYFPPEAKWGQPAWKDVVTQVGQSWQNPESRKKMLEAGSSITDALRKYAAVSRDPLAPDESWLENAFQAFKIAYDPVHGGFGSAPKFPMPVYHNFLLRYYARTKAREALDMVLQTLRAMARGGIYDHLGGGFARYSTDEQWHIPHFEKMLYDNAQLAANYLEAFQIVHEDDLRRVAEETLRYVQRELTHPAGGFYSAEDADSLPTADAKAKKEGAFYVWKKSEIVDILGAEQGERFSAAYGVRTDGNASSDPHGEFIGRNILQAAAPAGARSTALDFTRAREKLLEARAFRPRPDLDDKIISGWNGLMISAFAKAYQVLGDPGYLESARRAAQFLKKNLYDPDARMLYRRWRQSAAAPSGAATQTTDPCPAAAGDDASGIADDYAFVTQALIDLYETDGDPSWLDWAVELMETMSQRFYDHSGGGFFMTAKGQEEHLLLRIKEDSDNVEPSASSVAVLNLFRLAQYAGRRDFQEAAERTLQTFGSHLKEAPRAMPQMLVALDFYLTEPRQIVIAGASDAPDTKEMLRVLRSHFIPVKTVFRVEIGRGQARTAQALPFLADMKPVGGKATAYVCVRHTCKAPATDPEIFEELIKALE